MAEEDQGKGMMNWRGAGAGDGESCSGGVELALRLRTGSGDAAAPAAVRRRKSMTIFYGGRVCAVDVTDLQARAIITMANQDMILAEQNRHMGNDRHQDSTGSGSGSGSSAAPRSPPPAASRRDDHKDCLDAATAPAGLSMKRSLQRFLQKRKARAAAAPYAAGDRPAMPS